MLPRNIHRNLALIQAEVEARYAQKRLRVYRTWEEWFTSEAAGRISPLDIVMTEAKIRGALSKEALQSKPVAKAVPTRRTAKKRAEMYAPEA